MIFFKRFPIFLMPIFVSLLASGAPGDSKSPSASQDAAIEKRTDETKSESSLEKVLDKTANFGQQAIDGGKELLTQTNKKLNNSRSHRANKKHSLALSYTPIDTWIPWKRGLQYTYIESRSASWDLSIDVGSIGYGWLFSDIASISDERIILARTSYSQRNSFYLTYGLNYYKMSASLGSSLLSSVSGGDVPSLDVIEFSGLGASIGIGNRWQFKNWLFGVNWLSVHIPVISLTRKNAFSLYSSDPSAAEDVDDILKIVERVPNFTLFRFQLGYSF